MENNNSTARPRKKMTIWQWGFLALLIGCTVWILSTDRKQNSPQESRGKVFGTYYTMKYEYTESLDSLIMAELLKVDHSLSMFNKESQISRVNRNETDAADSLLSQVFLLSQQISVKTLGAFDVTVAPLVNAWGFGFENADSISSGKIDSILQFVGYEKVCLADGKFVKQDERMMMDFSAVAKGFGVDCVARLFDNLGIQNYMVEIGGEVVVKGKNPKGKLWTIEITRPTENEVVSAQKKILLEVSDIAMATSGNYRRFYVKDGKRYAHTIDGKSGYPVQHSLLSATVLADDCATADAYATSFMVMGVEKTQAFLENHPELSAYLIYSGDKGTLQTWTSPGMQRYVKK